MRNLCQGLSKHRGRIHWSLILNPVTPHCRFMNRSQPTQNYLQWSTSSLYRHIILTQSLSNIYSRTKKYDLSNTKNLHLTCENLFQRLNSLTINLRLNLVNCRGRWIAFSRFKSWITDSTNYQNSHKSLT